MPAFREECQKGPNTCDADAAVAAATASVAVKVICRVRREVEGDGWVLGEGIVFALMQKGRCACAYPPIRPNALCQ